MNIETRKVSIISWLTHLNNEEIISEIERLKDIEPDWWDVISNEEKSEIEHGLSEVERGETKTHEEVMSKYDKWL
jgi:hypothetical protein